MDSLLSRVAKITIPTTAMTAANAITIFDTTTLPNQALYRSCVVNVVMLANRSPDKNIVFNLSLTRGATEIALAHNMLIAAGQTWTTRPEGFLILEKGDKLVVWFNTAAGNGAICDAFIPYLYSTED